jgi:hypothetical protein
MKLMGHSRVTVSQKYVHPSPEAMERAVDLEALNKTGRQAVQVPTISTTVENGKDGKKPVFNVPGWRNRQTQGT